MIATGGNIFTVGLRSWHLFTAESKLPTLLTRTLVIAVWKSQLTYLFHNHMKETQRNTPCRPSHRTSTGTILPFISFLFSSGIFCAVDTQYHHLRPKCLKKIQKTTALTYFYITPCHHIRHKVLTRIHPPGICCRLQSRQIEITLFQIMFSNNTHGTDLIGPGYYTRNDSCSLEYRGSVRKNNICTNMRFIIIAGCPEYSIISVQFIAIISCNINVLDLFTTTQFFSCVTPQSSQCKCGCM